MGAIDLVVQIEAPPSRRQRPAAHRPRRPPGRRDQRRHHLPEVPRRSRRLRRRRASMHDGKVEATRYPRNPLDVLAQQIVAMTAMDRWTVDELFDTVRSAAPFAELDRSDVRRRARHAVGPLSVGRVRGAAPARHLGPRERHDRRARGREARRDRQRRHDSRSRPLRRVPGRRRPTAARASASSTKRWCSRRRAGEDFPARRVARGGSKRSRTTACSSSPAPGEPGKMPFWRGESVGRPLEFGRAIGALMRTLLDMSTRRGARSPRVEARPAIGRPRRTCCNISPISAPRPVRCRTIARS